MKRFLDKTPVNSVYKSIFEEGYGLVNLGRHLGLFYAPKGEMRHCPHGWLFIATEDTPNAEHIERIVGEYKKEIGLAEEGVLRNGRGGVGGVTPTHTVGRYSG